MSDLEKYRSKIFKDTHEPYAFTIWNGKDILLFFKNKEYKFDSLPKSVEWLYSKAPDFGDIVFFLKNINNGIELRIFDSNGELKTKPIEYNNEQVCIEAIRALINFKKQEENFLF